MKPKTLAEQLMQIADQLNRVAQSLIDERLRLYPQLSRKRREIANRYGVKPAYVATNEALYRMLTLYPQTMRELKRVEGIGRARSSKYGEDLLNALHEVVGESVELGV